MAFSASLMRTLMVLSAAAFLIASNALPVTAHWLTKLAREAGEAGGAAGKIGKSGIGALDNAAELVAKLPATGKGAALAAHVTPEGHWKFINRDGDIFTAATAEEMSRAVPTLSGGAATRGPLAFYIPEESLFAHRAALNDLPKDAKLHVVVGRNSYQLRGSGGSMVAELRPNLVVSAENQKLFKESLFHLARPLKRSSIRVLALEPAGPKTLSAVPNYDPATKVALVDGVDPSVLLTALGKLKHQTVLLTGQVDDGFLRFKPARGPESRISMAELSRAAEEADVSLVVLHASGMRQPGGRNWLWQKVSVAGLDDALKRATFGDFLNALGAGRGELVVSAQASGSGRITLSALPSGSASVPLTDSVGTWFTDMAGQLVGDVAVQGAQAFLPEKEHVEELDARIIPGIPSWIQIAYICSLIAGVMGWAYSISWWARVWPPERRSDYASAFGFHAARFVRLLALLFIFLPLVGIPALTLASLMQLWHWLTAPFRWLGWLGRKIGLLRRAETGQPS